MIKLDYKKAQRAKTRVREQLIKLATQLQNKGHKIKMRARGLAIRTAGLGVAKAPGAVAAISPAILEEMRLRGGPPFVMLRLVGRDKVESSYICGSQSDAPQFVHDLVASGADRENVLIGAINKALRLEIYDAADLLFSWAMSGGSDFSVTIMVGLPTAWHDNWSFYVGYPVILVDYSRPRPSGARERLEILRSIVDAYASAPGNDALRHAIVEGFALAVSRAGGALGELDKVRESLEVAKKCVPYSIFLKSADYALSLKVQGKEVPARLEKFIGEDNGSLRGHVCPEPFRRFDIGPSGDVLVCCGHWLPTSIGNFQRDAVMDILNSPQALKIRESVTDGTYKYCNHLECGAMIQGNLQMLSEIDDPVIKQAVSTRDFHLSGVSELLFAYDSSCNLSCPSCRRERIIEKASESEEKARAVEEKLKPLLKTLRILNINPAGEIFASRPSRKILELINDNSCPDLKLDIISNGTLFSEQEWNKFPGIHNKIRSIRISTDAARKATFEKLRRLGNWEVFNENMQFLSRLRKQGLIPQLKFSFTYQLENYLEMAEFITFTKGLGADFIIFERLQNLGAFGHKGFLERAVHLGDHRLHQDFLRVIRDPVFHDAAVWHDFDYDGVQKLSREEVKERLSSLG